MWGMAARPLAKQPLQDGSLAVEFSVSYFPDILLISDPHSHPQALEWCALAEAGPKGRAIEITRNASPLLSSSSAHATFVSSLMLGVHCLRAPLVCACRGF